MAKKDDDSLQMYMDLIGKTADELLDDTSNLLGYQGYRDDDYESEGFITSKEMVKNKKEMEERFGSNIPLPSGQVEIDEDFHYHRYTKTREHKYTEKEMEEIRESCKGTIVHDYGEYDIYHLSDEERTKNDMLAEISVKLGCLKSIYRKVDQYIYAMRTVVEAWELLAKNNYVHSDKEFFQMVAEGRIVSPRIIMPKLKKIDNYNKDLIIQYISNKELDPSELMPIETAPLDPWYDQFKNYDDDSEESLAYREYYNEYMETHAPTKEEEEDEDFDFEDLHDKADEYARDMIEKEEMERLLSPEEVEYILNNDNDNIPKIEVAPIKRKYIKNYDSRNLSLKKKKKSKKDQYIKESLHDMLNKIQNNPRFVDNSEYSSTYMLTNSMFEQEKPEKDVWDELFYDGSWTDEDGLKLYDINVTERLMQERPPKERYLTYGEKQLKYFFDTLEKNGVNVVDIRRKMNATDDDYNEETARKEKKINKKVESELLQRITALNNSAKFKKIVHKAEKAINEQIE